MARTFNETTKDYHAALRGAAVAFRPGRRFLEVTGKAPGEMLKGILTGKLPGKHVASESGPSPAGGASGADQGGEAGSDAVMGDVCYSSMLTPKGKMITDLRVFRGLEDGFLLDLPEAGMEGALEHFRKFLPPRLATIQDRGDELSVLTLLGPEVLPLMGQVVGEGSFSPTLLEDLAGQPEGREMVLRGRGSPPLRITRNGDVPGPAWDVLIPSTDRAQLQTRLEAGGAVPLSQTTWDVLRVEKGRPAFGVDMDQETIPVEAGIHIRAIDYTKGCFTGHEVIIRIRDRGKASKHLRRLLLGDAPIPEGSEPLYVAGREKAVGRITSACWSPALGEGLALGYVGREVEPGEEVRVGEMDGPPARVQLLDPEGTG
jgi:tRNA-modifying protein YgfZ